MHNTECITGKRAYRKEKNALNYLRRIKKTGRIVSSDFLPYKCPHCNKWHLGHRNKYLKIKGN